MHNRHIGSSDRQQRQQHLSPPNCENVRHWRVNDLEPCIVGNSYSDWLQTSIYQILAAFTGKNNSDMLPAASWEWASTKRQQCEFLHIWESRHRVDLRTQYKIIDCLDWQEYNIWTVKHRFQLHWYYKLQSVQKCIIGCWKRDSDKILITNNKHKSHTRNYRWTGRATHWQHTQFRPVWSLPSNSTQVDGSGSLTTTYTQCGNVRFGSRSGPEVTVRNGC
jgi:hypothetical protein